MLLVWHFAIWFVLQAAVLPDAEFPGLPTSSPDHATEAPKWPIQRVRDKQSPATSDWGTPATPPQIPAKHWDAIGTDNNYSSWDAEVGNDWGGADAGGKWADSAEVEEDDGGWTGEQTNRHHESSYVEGAKDDSPAARTQGMLPCPVITHTQFVSLCECHDHCCRKHSNSSRNHNHDNNINQHKRTTCLLSAGLLDDVYDGRLVADCKGCTYSSPQHLRHVF